MAQPRYPKPAQVQRLEGVIVLQGKILADGTVGDVRGVECNRPGWGFEEAAIDAAMKWLYKPALVDRDPVCF